MGCDLLAALGAATVSKNTLLGVNHFGLDSEQAGLFVLSAKDHASGEMVAHPRVKIPEARQTARVLGWQAPGDWGLSLGCNDRQVAAGVCRWKSRFRQTDSGLDGPDLVRLVLERGLSARQALDTLCELIERHGQTHAQGDHIFLLADPHEAYIVEAAGTFWASMQCQQTRAVCDAGIICQDWQRLCRGLAEHVIENGWWPADGSKINFHASVADGKFASPAILKRWSRASLSLAQQENSIDQYCLRRMLLDHFEQCQDLMPRQHVWQGTQIVSLAADLPAIMWTAPPQLGTPLFFPLVAGAPLPGLWLDGLPPLNRLWGREDARAQEVQDRLQSIFDQDGEAFARAAHGAAANEVLRHAQEMMARHAELYLKECQSIRGGGSAKPKPRHDDVLAFVAE